MPLLVHRLSLVIHGQAVKEGDCVLHKCDNPSCVRPDHLFIGDRKANVDDMIQKKRMPRGEERCNAKLDPQKVIEIIVRVKAGETRSSLAKEYGVSQSLLTGICNGSRWSHLMRASLI